MLSRCIPQSCVTNLLAAEIPPKPFGVPLVIGSRRSRIRPPIDAQVADGHHQQNERNPFDEKDSSRADRRRNWRRLAWHWCRSRIGDDEVLRPSASLLLCPRLPRGLLPGESLPAWQVDVGVLPESSPSPPVSRGP